MLIVQLIIFQLFIFGVLVFVLRRVMSENVTKATQRLEVLSAEYMKKEEALKKEQAELYNKQNETMESAKRQALEIRDKAEKEAKEESAKMIENARKEGETIVERANSCMREMAREMDAKIKKEASQKALALIGRVLPDDIKKKTHAKWSKDLVEGPFASLGKMRFGDDIKKAEITTAYALSSDEISSIKKKLEGELKREIETEEKVDPSIVAGIIVRVGSVILDGSLLSKAKELAEKG